MKEQSQKVNQNNSSIHSHNNKQEWKEKEEIIRKYSMDQALYEVILIPGKEASNKKNYIMQRILEDILKE